MSANQIHIYLSFFALSLLGLATVQAIWLAIKNHLLKHHHHRTLWLGIFPPLQTMEEYLFVILGTGVLFLSASLITGLFFQPFSHHPQLVPKIILGILAWIFLVLLLIGRYFFGWRGRTAVCLTMMCTLMVILSYFGTKALII